MPDVVCAPLRNGVVLRATRLDSCGNPEDGENNSVVTDGFISVATTAVIEDGTDYQVKKANGRFCIDEKGCPTFRRFDLTVTLCQVDPALYELTSGQAVVLDADGNTVGFDTDDVPCDGGFALEVWTLVGGEDACAGGDQHWGYVLYPWVQNGILGDLTIEDGPVSFTLKGNTKRNPNWARGPWNVVDQGGGAPGPLLTDIGTAQRRILLTTIEPPASDCAYGSVPAPVTVDSVDPDTMAEDSTDDIVIGGTGFAAGATVSLSGGDITVNTVTVDSGIQITANITVDAGADHTARDITVTNTDSGTGTGVGLLTITA